MAIVSFDKDAIINYVPEFGGNRDADDPCVVRLKFVPYARMQNYTRLLNAKKGAANEAETAQEAFRKQFLDNVVSVSGFSVMDPASGALREITDPAEFMESIESEFFFEIINAMSSSAKLTEGQRKNS